jgi:hypothetical protein
MRKALALFRRDGRGWVLGLRLSHPCLALARQQSVNGDSLLKLYTRASARQKSVSCDAEIRFATVNVLGDRVVWRPHDFLQTRQETCIQ